ncbi:MAG: Modification methylase BamHI [Planctomycetes bacterium]|nr:Modification methylase BamHI [Planctomycetota bacterium]
MHPPILTTDLGRLHRGDCLDLLAATADGAFDLVFADPPFNLGKDYGKDVGDARAEAEYVAWCGRWIDECARALRPGGAFFLFNLPKWNVVLAPRILAAGLEFRHWIAVDLKLSLPIRGRLYPSHYSLLYFTKGKPRVFHGPRVPVPACRHCGGDLKDYGGHRGKLNPAGLNVSDVWTDIPPVRHRATKRRGANELSEKLLRRVVEMTTDPGDLVFDPFGGSGTTYAVCEQLGRRWVGCELGDCAPIVARLRGEASLFVPPQRGDAGRGARRK